LSAGRFDGHQADKSSSYFPLPVTDYSLQTGKKAIQCGFNTVAPKAPSGLAGRIEGKFFELLVLSNFILAVESWAEDLWNHQAYY
jgi:hypothetical protein